MRRSIITAALSCGVAICLAGCASTEEPDASMAIFNSECPIMEGSDVDPEAKTVSYQGKTIGFCCSGCEKKWSDLSDADKQAFVKKAAASH